MSLEPRVPTIDLSPDVPSPLTLWRISDYLALWNWVLYRPHTLQAYIRANQINNPQVQIFPRIGNDEAVADLLMRYRNQAVLFGLVSFSVVGISLLFLMLFWALIWLMGQLNQETVALDWVCGLQGMGIGIAVVFTVCLVFVSNQSQCTAAQLLLGISTGTLSGIFAMGMCYQLSTVVAMMLVAFGIGLAWGVYRSTLRCYSTEFSLPLLIVLLSIISVALLGIEIGEKEIEIESAFWVFLAGLTGVFITIFRFDDWLINWNDRRNATVQDRQTMLPRVTCIPVWGLAFDVENHLEDNWALGLQNCQEILLYTRQSRAMLAAIRQIMEEEAKEKKGTLVGKMEQLWQAFVQPPIALPELGYPTPVQFRDIRIFIPPKEQLLRDKWHHFSWLFIAPSATTRISPKSDKEQTRQDMRQEFRQGQQSRESYRVPLKEKLVLDSGASAAAGGLWYLERIHPKEASAAFSEATFSPLGRELAAVSKGLETLWSGEYLPQKGYVALPRKPDKAKHVSSWDALSVFQNIVRYIWLLNRCADEAKYRLVENMLYAAVQQLRDSLTTDIESPIIQLIAEDWRADLTALLADRSYISGLDPVNVPYVFAEPLTVKKKALLVDRKTEQTRLKEAWQVGNFQPVLICGQHQSGKTSLVCATADLSMKLAVIKFRQLEVRSSTLQLLQAICDEIRRQNIYPTPVTEKLLEDPYRIFSDHIKQVCLELGQTGLVIALDEFEFIEENSNPLELRGLMSYLWSLSQSESNLGVVFLTASTLPELSRTFDTQFTRYMQPIVLDFLTEKGVAQLLRNPRADFLPYCHDLAVRRVLALTAGQPYLVQLCATFIFKWYNEQIRAQNALDPLLIDVDVDSALESSEFHLQCRRYFLGLCDEVKRIENRHARQILKQIAMAPSPPQSNLILRGGLQLQRIESILASLEEHLIIEKASLNDNLPPRWQIKVQLFRDWLRTQ